MNIRLIQNKSVNNRANKKLETIDTLSGKLRNETSITDPVILIDGNIEDLAECNYFYIPKFKRYYFMTDMKSIRNNLLEIHGHCDVLTTAYLLDNLKQCKGIVNKQEEKWNLLLNDGTFRVYQDPIITTELFPSGFNSFSYVLAVAGSEQ